MIQTIKKNWQSYLMEAAGLGGFVVGAGLLAILLEHPDLAVMNSFLKDYPLLRRLVLGIIMGGYVAGVTLLFGKRSGAQINPAVTWTFFRLGKINFADALWYTIAQFAGAIVAAQLLKHFTGDLFGHPLIDFGVTKPKPQYGTMTAFAAEFVISFILMLILLFAGSSKYFEKKIALISGMLLAFYLAFETPFSGMSLNPARSFAGALAANEWKHLWLYFIAPLSAMLLAASIFQQKKESLKKNKGYKELAIYPAEKSI